MGLTKKSWSQKMNAKPSHSVILDKSFAGVPAGAKLLISCPIEVQQFLFKIPVGTTLPVQEFRRQLAYHHHCDAACPVSTAIFLKIVAEHSWEQFNSGVAIQDIAPFWRVIDPKLPLAKKLSFDAQWIADRRDIESNAK